MSRAILVIEDEATVAKNIKRYMEKHAYDVQVAGDGAEGLRQIEKFKPDLVLLDFNLPDMNGLEVLKTIRGIDTGIRVILITGHGNVQLAVDAMKAGAHDYLSKPLVLSELKLVIERTISQETLEKALSYYHRKEADRSGLSKILGESPAIRRCKQQIMQLIEAEHMLTDDDPPAVLVTGETGTGKELVARALHYDGKRSKRPLVEINCASIPEHLIESEFFGFERGAFTDARQRKLGLAESADGGTLFLDEIGDLQLNVQAKLLKLLEDKTFRRLGSVRDRRVNIRVIAATNQPLEDLMRQGKFRPDLYYRIKVVNLELPPLRERGDDIILLAEYFLELHGSRYARPELKFSVAARDDILRHSWPGNVRELSNVIEQAVLITKGDLVRPGFFPCHPALARAEIRDLGNPTDMKIDAPAHGSMKIEEVELALIRKALEDCAGNVTRAAEVLGISRDKLRYRMEKYDFRTPN